MNVEIKIPSFGESVVEATIGTIFKPSGSSVQVDDDILELETDKLNQVLHAPNGGKIHLTVKTGDVVKVGQVIGSIDTDFSSAIEPEKEKREEAPSQKVVQKPLDRRQKRVKMTKLRRVIAERLVQVKNQTAMLTTFNEIDMSRVIAIREKEQENFQQKYGIKLGFMSFFIRASIAALKEFPEINGQIEGEELVYNEFYNIAVAVSTDKGLMVPVMRDADLLDSAEIEKQLKVLAEKARTGEISVDDLQGGSFTITNAGLFGSLFSTPILNPPQSGILGMHNIVKRAVVVNDEIVIRPMMYVALSYDHRIVDGKQAVSFLMHIKKNLEELIDRGF